MTTAGISKKEGSAIWTFTKSDGRAFVYKRPQDAQLTASRWCSPGVWGQRHQQASSKPYMGLHCLREVAKIRKMYRLAENFIMLNFVRNPSFLEYESIKMGYNFSSLLIRV